MTGDDLRDAEAAVLARLDRHAAGRLLAVAAAFQAEAKRDYSVPNPAPHLAPAPRGRHPRARTFNLRDAIAVEPATAAGVMAAGEVRVGVLRGAWYGAVLTARGWEGLADTLARVRGRLARIGGG